MAAQTEGPAKKTGCKMPGSSLRLTVTEPKNSPSGDGEFDVRGSGSEILLQLDAVCIGVQGAGQQTDQVDQSPDAAANAGAAGQDDLDDAVLVVAQVEIVDAEAAQEEGQQSSDQLGLLLTAGSSAVDGEAAGGADGCTGLGGLTAVVAEVAASLV